jgi:hypothetical protein
MPQNNDRPVNLLDNSILGRCNLDSVRPTPFSTRLQRAFLRRIGMCRDNRVLLHSLNC